MRVRLKLKQKDIPSSIIVNVQATKNKKNGLSFMANSLAYKNGCANIILYLPSNTEENHI